VLLARGCVQLELLVERLLDPNLCADERLALYSVILAFENFFASTFDLSNETRCRCVESCWPETALSSAASSLRLLEITEMYLSSLALTFSESVIHNLH
jgi:hypothetical protein